MQTRARVLEETLFASVLHSAGYVNLATMRVPLTNCCRQRQSGAGGALNWLGNYHPWTRSFSGLLWIVFSLASCFYSSILLLGKVAWNQLVFTVVLTASACPPCSTTVSLMLPAIRSAPCSACTKPPKQSTSSLPHGSPGEGLFASSPSRLDTKQPWLLA